MTRPLDFHQALNTNIFFNKRSYFFYINVKFTNVFWQCNVSYFFHMYIKFEQYFLF